jgi:hypothetical protein
MSAGLQAKPARFITAAAAMYNPCIRGWITYYSHFYKTQLRPTLTRIVPMSFAGHAASSSGCVIEPKERETGSADSVGRTLISSRIGYYAMATAEHREPCESRGSCTVLGAPRGEIPLGDSTRARMPPTAPARCKCLCNRTESLRRSEQQAPVFARAIRGAVSSGDYPAVLGLIPFTTATRSARVLHA